MTFSPHKGMDLAKICISKMVYYTSLKQVSYSGVEAESWIMNHG